MNGARAEMSGHGWALGSGAGQSGGGRFDGVGLGDGNRLDSELGDTEEVAAGWKLEADWAERGLDGDGE